MTEEKHYFNCEPEDMETGIELEGFCDIPSIKIKNLNIKNLTINLYGSDFLGGVGDE